VGELDFDDHKEIDHASITQNILCEDMKMPCAIDELISLA